MVQIDGGAGAFIGVLLLLLFVAAAIAIIVIAVHVSAIRRLRWPRIAEGRLCPHCASPIRRAAGVCVNCGRESPGWVLHQGTWWSTDPDGNRVWLDERTNRWMRQENEQGDA